MIYNMIVYEFPFISGFKVLLGCIVTGLFISLDMALARERIFINQGFTRDTLFPAHKKLNPVTRRFTYIALITALFISLAIGMVVFGDIIWIVEVDPDNMSLAQAKWAILKEILFVTLVVMALVINLILSYSKNLSLLFANETRVLKRVSQGDLSQLVPVVSNDEFGVIARHTNDMIRGLRHRLQLMTSLKLAEEISQNLLPKSTPAIQGLDIAGRSIYCDETGGDYFDYLTVAKKNDGSIGIVVGDVSGHGIESALLMTTLRAFLRQRSSMEGRISDIVSDVNIEITRDIGDSGHFITLIYIQIDKKENELHWVCAGHDPGIIYDSNSNIFSELFNHGVPLGIEEKSKYPESKLVIKPGQVILLGTDGLWETHNNQNEMFGKDNLKKIIQDNADKPAINIVDNIVDEIDTFRSSKKQEDDLTLVVIKVEK